MSNISSRIDWWVELALAELENAMDALHKLNRETDIVDDVEYNKINRAIWDIEQVLKEWKEENKELSIEEWNQGFRR